MDPYSPVSAARHELDVASQPLSNNARGERRARNGHHIAGMSVVCVRVRLIAQLGTVVREDMFQAAFLHCYKQIEDDTQFKVFDTSGLLLNFRPE
jgi:hypothetical protein